MIVSTNIPVCHRFTSQIIRVATFPALLCADAVSIISIASESHVIVRNTMFIT